MRSNCELNSGYNACDESAFPALGGNSNNKEREHKENESPRRDNSLSKILTDQPSSGSHCSSCNVDMISPPRRILQCIKVHFFYIFSIILMYNLDMF